jgi:hypothetical protein
MLRFITSFATAGILLSNPFVFATSAAPVTVALFNNDTFVDTTGAGGFPGESATVHASLTSLGYAVTTFTGFTAADFTAAGNSANLILFPEFERADLQAALSSSARAALANYVTGGGGVVVIGSYTTRDVDFLNTVFGFSLSDAGLALSTFGRNDTAALGTPYATGPASLPFESDTAGVEVNSLPTGALNLYSGIDVVSGVEDSVVFLTVVGQGKIGYLGWDWFDAKPLGSVDEGWLATLNTTVAVIAVPEPSSFGLAAISLMLISAISLKSFWKRNYDFRC